MSENHRCELCQSTAECDVDHRQRQIHVNCPRCGKYLIAKDMAEDILSRYKDRYHILSGCIRERTEHSDLETGLSEESIEDMLGLAPRTVLEKAHRLLQSLARRSEFPGQEIELLAQVSPSLGYCKNESELRFFVEHLRVQRLIDARPAGQTDDRIACTVLPDGWTSVEMSRPGNLVSDKAFVAMWFDLSMKLTYDEAIKSAIAKAGYRPVRIDAEEFNSDVVERIIGEIRESRFVVADVTGQRNGVYFEGGFAFGLALPVIWMCREDEVSKLHFDTRQLNHIVWKDNAQIQERLLRRILATIGPGPTRRAGVAI
jgi:hypothetical protein